MNQEERPWTKYWIQNFRNHPVYGSKRFKKLNIGYPPFDIDLDLMDEVPLQEFILLEDDRIPFFIGSQFGVHPTLKDLPEFFNGKKLYATLGKSLLSGRVAGLSLYQLEETDKAETIRTNPRKIVFFANSLEQ